MQNWPKKKESQLFSNTRTHSGIYENTWRHSHKHHNVAFASFVTDGSTFVWDGRRIRDQTSFMEGSVWLRRIIRPLAGSKLAPEKLFRRVVCGVETDREGFARVLSQKKRRYLLARAVCPTHLALFISPLCSLFKWFYRRGVRSSAQAHSSSGRCDAACVGRHGHAGANGAFKR